MNSTKVIIFVILMVMSVVALVTTLRISKESNKNKLVVAVVFFILAVVAGVIFLTVKSSGSGSGSGSGPGPGPPVQKTTLNVDYITIEYSPYTYSAVDTISPWFNNAITQMGKDDVALFMTDYMIIHQDIVKNMKTAIQNGAKFILGADRWYICGKPYSCSGSNNCPNCQGKSPPANCHCNIPGADGCNSFNTLLNQLDYCQNKQNIILMDSPSYTTDENKELWGHAHRKIINFYYKNANKANIISGSWNIDADLNRQNLGVKETSLGINTTLDSPFAQYMLQQDIDTLTPIVLYVPNMTEDGLTLLKSLKKSDGYPKLPIHAIINWSADDITKSTYGSNPTALHGTDKDVEIWMGISPPPQGSPNKFDSPKDIVYGEPAVNPDKWQDQYDLMLAKTSMCKNNEQAWCKNKKLDFAKGATWAGLLFEKFFADAAKSPFINISMYMHILDANQPCGYLDGAYGYTGCNPNNYHKSGWYTHGFPLMFPAIRDYVKNSNTTMRILDGVYNTKNVEAFQGLWMMSKLAGLTSDEQKRIHIRWFNQAQDNNGDLSCSNYCGAGSCCRNHEKLYMSDKNLLISSGHPSRGYYSDINGINNDILFLNAPTLTSVFNDHFKIGWQKQSVSINSKTNPKQVWWNQEWDGLTTPTYKN